MAAILAIWHTSSNMQAWSVVEVMDPDRKRRLAEVMDRQKLLEQAPLLLVFCADVYRLRLITEQRGWAFKYDQLDQLLKAAIDSALACQTPASMDGPSTRRAAWRWGTRVARV